MGFMSVDAPLAILPRYCHFGIFLRRSRNAGASLSPGDRTHTRSSYALFPPFQRAGTEDTQKYFVPAQLFSRGDRWASGAC